VARVKTPIERNSLEEKEATTPAAPEEDEFGKAVEEVAKEVGVDAAKLEAAILAKLEKFLNLPEEEEEPEEAFDAAAIAAKARGLR
jgi:hypothetical protein